MAPTESSERTFEMNAVICTFNIDKEGLHSVSSIKTDIYYRLGWLWFAAISKWTQDYGRTRSTFQNKPQVSFSNIRPVPTGPTDPTDRFITLIVYTCIGLYVYSGPPLLRPPFGDGTSGLIRGWPLVRSISDTIYTLFVLCNCGLIRGVASGEGGHI